MRYRLVKVGGAATEWSKQRDSIEQRGNYLYALNYSNGKPHDGGIGAMRYSDDTSDLSDIAYGKWYLPGTLTVLRLTPSRMKLAVDRRKVAALMYDYVELDGAGDCEECGDTATRVLATASVRNARVNDPEYTQHYLCAGCYQSSDLPAVAVQWWARPSKMPALSADPKTALKYNGAEKITFESEEASV
jgi:hypothetical protein